MQRDRDQSQDSFFYFAKTLARHFSVYGLFDLLGRASLFILVPLYARLLTLEDFGVLEIFTVSAAVLLLFAVFGLNSALTRYYTTESDPVVALATFRTAFTTVAVVGGSVCLLTFIAAPLLSRLVFGGPEWALEWRLVAAIVFLDSLVQILLALFRSRSRPVLYSVVNLVKLLTTLVANVVIVGVLHHGVAGALTGTLLGVSLGLVTGFVLVAPENPWGWSGKLLKRMAAFGFPLVWSGLALFIMNSSDRYFLKAYTSLGQLGLYSFGYKIGMAMAIVVNAMVVAWPPILFRIAENPRASEIYGRLLTYFIFLMSVVLVAFGSFTAEIVAVVGGGAYDEAEGLVVLVLLSYIFFGIYYFFSGAAGLTETTRILPFIVASSATLNIVGNLVLIPRWGMWGAAWSTLAAFILMALLMAWRGQKLYPFTLEKRRLLVLAVTTATVVSVNSLLIGSEGLRDAALKAILIAAFPVGLALGGFFEKDELHRAKAMLGRWRTGPR